MTKQHALDKAKILFRDNDQSYYVIHNPQSDEFEVLDEKEYKSQIAQLSRYVIFSLEAC